MKKLLLPLLILLPLSGCSLTPPKDFRADLDQQIDGGQSCANIGMNLIATGGGNEIITVEFGKTRKILELVPEGAKKSTSPVYWSRTSYYDELQRYALLTMPEKLKVGAIDQYNNKKICIKFYPEAFCSAEHSLEEFSELADKTCCGTLQPKSDGE